MYPCTEVLVMKYELDAFMSHLKQKIFSNLDGFSHVGRFWWADIHEKNILQLNIKRSQSVHMDFMIYLSNIGDRESENQKDLCALVAFSK